MTTGTPDPRAGDDARADEPGTADAAEAEPTPGSDNDGAEAGYTPPSGSDDAVTD